MKALLSEATANRQFAYMCVGGGGGERRKGSVLVKNEELLFWDLSFI